MSELLPLQLQQEVMRSVMRFSQSITGETDVKAVFQTKNSVRLDSSVKRLYQKAVNLYTIFEMVHLNDHVRSAQFLSYIELQKLLAFASPSLRSPNLVQCA